MITGPQHRGEPSCNRRRAPLEARNSSEQLPSLTADEVLMSYIRVTFPSDPPPTVMLQLPVKHPSASCLRLTPLINAPAPLKLSKFIHRQSNKTTCCCWLGFFFSILATFSWIDASVVSAHACVITDLFTPNTPVWLVALSL